ncbi:MAG: transpeptidase family protein [Saprospiraceae bacterium]|nr:transpeptidase family protein [Saprospiraceae bacterium]
MNVKNEVLYRVYFILFMVVIPVALMLVYKTMYISYAEGDFWRQKGKDMYVEPRSIEADRGNILASNGHLLATSIPFFDLYFDPNSTGMSEEDFKNNVDSLSYLMATYVDNSFTPGGYKEYLIQKRKSGSRYVLIKQKATFEEKRLIESFPLFSLGQMRGGFIVNQRNERMRPFGILAQRTIGYVRDNAKPVGLEAVFDGVLGGRPGLQNMVCVDKAKDIWLPVNALTEVEPRRGDDVKTTLDINIQDISQEALLRAMNYHNAEWGTVVVMEVKTGAVRAIANLGRTEEGWWETFNHAVGTAIEPGSTFKIATMMAFMEDGMLELSDSVSIENGKTKFYEDTMEDSSPFSARLDTITVQRAFEISSNVGMAKLAQQYYGKKEKINRNQGAERFIERLKSFNLHLPTGIEVAGEAAPYIKEAYSSAHEWSGTTLPWMAIGYELRLTPLQILTMYNAIANDGEMMKPYLVSEIQRDGKALQTFKPTVAKRQIASKSTIKKAKLLLESVVDRGTAEKLRHPDSLYRFAGKTGTAQIGYRKVSNKTFIRGYQASFVGYFPAENPVYSCIVVINNPKANGFYGSDVAGPVFREIADYCYVTATATHEAINVAPPLPLAAKQMPNNSIGYTQDIEYLLNSLKVPFYKEAATDWSTTRVRSDSLVLEKRTIVENIVPNVEGMGLRDAIFLMENRGLKVSVTGVGKVARQSLRPGTRARGQTVHLTLG